MLLDSVQTLPARHTEYDLNYLPMPNQVDVVLTSTPSPSDLTLTGFVVPILADGRAVFARNRRRGLEIPGGHRIAGESVEQAARREVLEETGCVVEALIPIGFLRMQSQGLAPEHYPYPHPISFQQFFAANVVSRQAFCATKECLPPRLLQPTQVARALGRHRFSHRLFHQAALRSFSWSLADLVP